MNELYVRFIPEKASIKFFSVCVPAYLLAKCILSFHSLIRIIPIYVLTFVLSFVNKKRRKRISPLVTNMIAIENELIYGDGLVIDTFLCAF